MSEKKEESARRKELLHNPKNGYDRLSSAELGEMESVCCDYRRFLDAAKTERLAAAEAIRRAEAAGFVPFKRGDKLKAGDKVYRANGQKAVVLAVVGKKSPGAGLNIVAAHIDAPRIDVKAVPLYEDGDMLLCKTHYYGGIKKYQWVATPLTLCGRLYKADGSAVDICVGDCDDDPVFVITDLLPHLAAEQMKKTMSEGITGEDLNAILGSIPDSEEKEGSDRIKLAVMTMLNAKYGITESDFLSAELSFVPSAKAREVGFDRSLIGSYGHDDRVCSYTALRALLDAGAPERTALCILADKEEIGSEGVTGMQSAFYDSFISDLCRSTGCDGSDDCCENSFCLSADVCAAFDPNYPSVSDKRNNSRINYGVTVVKYTGSRGKGGASDASAEDMSELRTLLDSGGVIWQSSELGKVDCGGGGTVAAYLARRNIRVVDIGVGVLSMHAPFELVSKLDTYMAYRAYKALYANR